MNESLKIGLALSPTWLRGQAWRRNDSAAEQLFDLDFTLRAAELAEAANLHFVFKPDALMLSKDSFGTTPGFSSLEPMTMLAAIAARTTRIGIIPTISTTFAQPYTVARQLSTLDWLFPGRIGWNAVTSLGGSNNYPEVELPPEPYAKAHEFMVEVQQLRASYPHSALVIDRLNGVFGDPDELSRSGSGRGPSNTPARSAEELPVLHAGGSPASIEFAAKHATAVFGMHSSAALGREYRQVVRAAARAVSRPAPLVLPGLSLYLAETTAEAVALAAEHRDNRPTHVQHWEIIGTVEEAAEQIADRARTGAIDGFIALPAGCWDSLELFASALVPTLINTGLFRSEIEEGSLQLQLSKDPS